MEPSHCHVTIRHSTLFTSIDCGPLPCYCFTLLPAAKRCPAPPVVADIRAVPFRPQPGQFVHNTTLLYHCIEGYAPADTAFKIRCVLGGPNGTVLHWEGMEQLSTCSRVTGKVVKTTLQLLYCVTTTGSSCLMHAMYAMYISIRQSMNDISCICNFNLLISIHCTY